MDETQTISPKQNEIQCKLALTNDILVALYHKRSMGLLSENDGKELKKNQVILSSLKKDMKKCLQNVMRQKKHRTMTQAKLKSLKHESSQMSSSTDNSISQQSKSDNELLCEAITLIALSGSAAHERRRSDIVRSVKTLDQLTIALQKEGFDLKRGSVYLRLLPRNASTKEGKRHILTAPVKLIRPSNSKHSDHPSILFARASINYLEELAGLLGPLEVTFHTQDDKCKYPSGLQQQISKLH